MEIGKSAGGYDFITVHGAVVSDLAPFLDPDLPVCWLVGHRPHEFSVWGELRLPISQTKYLDVLARGTSYDLQLPTKQFLEQLAEFDAFGIDLIQMRRPVPHTLHYHQLPAEELDRILVQNGAFMRIQLPHAIETAMVVCYEDGYLARRLQQLDVSTT